MTAMSTGDERARREERVAVATRGLVILAVALIVILVLVQVLLNLGAL